jgi:hypothetical protein
LKPGRLRYSASPSSPRTSISANAGTGISGPRICTIPSEVIRHATRVPAARRVRGLTNSLPLFENREGAGNAGCTLHPRSRVQCAQKSAHTSIQGSGGNPTFPAQWLYGLLRALLGDRAFLPPSLANESANLTPASGRRDHTTSPYAFAPFVKSASASTASRRAFRDDREPPLLSGETGRFNPVICPSAKAKYFRFRGLTRFPKIRIYLPVGRDVARSARGKPR